jgi:hypothetical protein
MLTVAMTAPTPMIIPNAVRKDRILFRPKALRATRIVLDMFIVYTPLSQTLFPIQRFNHAPLSGSGHP